MADDNRPEARGAEPEAALTSSSSYSSTTVTPAHDGGTNGIAQYNGHAGANGGTVARSDVPAESPVAAAQAPGKPPVEPETERTQLETTLIILSLCSALFLAALDVTIVTVAVPSITEEFNSPTGYTWIGSAYLLASSAGAPIWGKISDIWGRKPILLIAVAVFWVGSVLSATSINMSMLIASRAIQGIGGGGIVILVNICVSDLFSMRKRGLYLGIMGMVWAVAGGVGPIVGGAFTSKVTWRWCFYINLPISGLGFAVLVFVLKLHNPRTPIRQGLLAVDWLGVVTIVGATLMVLLGLVMGGVSYPWNSPTIICLIVFGFVVAAIFVVIEWKVAKYPIIPLRLFKDRSNVAAFLVCSCHGFVFISGAYYLPLYFQAVLGASPLLSGTYVLPYTISLAVASTITGIFIKKTGKYKPPIIFGLLMMTLGYGLFIDLGPTANWAKIVVFQLIAGIGLGPNFQAPLIALQNTVGPKDTASITGTFAFIRQLATAISVVVGGVVFQNTMGKQYDSLLPSLGPQTAGLLTAGNAGASVGIVATLPGTEGDIARGAYWNALKTMYYMYLAFAASGIPISFLIRTRNLSKEHHEHKTGLAGMKEEERKEKEQKEAMAAQGLGVDQEKGHGVLGDEKVGEGEGRREADGEIAKEER